MKSPIFAILLLSLFGARNSPAVEPSSADIWDVTQGVHVSASSDAASPYRMFGENGQAFVPDNTYMYFSDGKPANYLHYVEWTTPSPITLHHIRLFAVGDGPQFNNEREFASFKLKTKSQGSSEYDVTILAYTPTHPYTFLDRSNWLIID